MGLLVVQTPENPDHLCRIRSGKRRTPVLILILIEEFASGFRLARLISCWILCRRRTRETGGGCCGCRGRRRCGSAVRSLGTEGG
jgi:hypothetical protein